MTERVEGGRTMKQSISVRHGEYKIEVDEFDSWISAISELVLGSAIMRIALIVGDEVIYDPSAPLRFPDGVLTSKERIVCALLLRYPEGVSKEHLTTATGMKPDSVATYLTSKQEGLAEGFVKLGDDYAIRKDMVGWALDMVMEAIEKCEKHLAETAGN